MLKGKDRLRVFENRVLRRYLYLRGIKLRETGAICTVRRAIICILRDILLA
jgi:hypothetical protein